MIRLLISLSMALPGSDTLDVAVVSAPENVSVSSLAPVQTMTRHELERKGTIGLDEILNGFSAVSVKDYGGLGGLKTVSIRNMGASHTSVIYDGIAVSDAQNGQVDISRFMSDDIASVSVTIGTQDDIYVPARHLTSAGVLHIRTLWPDFTHGGTRLSARVSAGSFDTYGVYLSLHQSIGSAYALSVSVNGNHTDGDYPYIIRNGNIYEKQLRQNGDMNSVGGEMNFHADWKDRGTLRAKVNMLSSERGLPGAVVLYADGGFERLWDRSLISDVAYDLNIGNRWKVHADAGYMRASDRHVDSNPIYQSVQDSRYLQQEFSLAARALYMLSDHWHFSAAEDLFFNVFASNLPECPFPVRTSSVTALSAMFRNDAFKASVSLVGTAVTETLGKGDAPADRLHFSPVVGLSWNFFRDMYVRASCKDGFRVPTFNDLYYARVGNRGLRPEKALQTNLGLTLSETVPWGRLAITLDGYYNHIRDKIVAVPTMFIWKMHNVGRVMMYGTDATLRLDSRLSSWMSLGTSLGYSLQYAVDMTSVTSKNYMHQIPYTPRHCGNADLTVETPWVNLCYRVNAVGKRYSNAQNIAANEMDAYADHTVSLNRNFTFGRRHPYNIYIGIELMNLSGVNHQVINNYPMPGRAFRITLKFSY